MRGPFIRARAFTFKKMQLIGGAAVDIAVIEMHIPFNFFIDNKEVRSTSYDALKLEK